VAAGSNPFGTLLDEILHGSTRGAMIVVDLASEMSLVQFCYYTSAPVFSVREENMSFEQIFGRRDRKP
jgi:hypothetical protein